MFLARFHHTAALNHDVHARADCTRDGDWRLHFWAAADRGKQSTVQYSRTMRSGGVGSQGVSRTGQAVDPGAARVLGRRGGVVRTSRVRVKSRGTHRVLPALSCKRWTGPRPSCVRSSCCLCPLYRSGRERHTFCKPRLPYSTYRFMDSLLPFPPLTSCMQLPLYL